MTSWFQRPVEVRLDVREAAIAQLDTKLECVLRWLAETTCPRQRRRLDERRQRLERALDAAGAL
jgi:hypothetical protein